MNDKTITKYPHNALEGFGNGCLLDLRVRFAMLLLQQSPMYSTALVTTSTTDGDGTQYLQGAMTPQLIAQHALDLATEVLDLAAERGLVEPLPDDGELSTELKLQARRTAGFSLAQQMEGQRMAQDLRDRVVPVAPMAGGGRH